MDQDKVPKLKLTLFFSQYYYLLAAVTIVASLLVAAFWVIKPKYLEVKESEVFLAARFQEELQEAYQYEVSLDKLINNYRAIERMEREALLNIVPPASEIPEILLAIDTLAKNSNLEVLAIDISGEVDEETMQSITNTNSSLTKGKTTSPQLQALPAAQAAKASDIDLDLRTLDIAINLQGGNYEILKLFLESLEQSRRLIDVVSLNFSSDLSNYTLNLRLYYLPEK